jgi:DHA2 family multidrug resistance protein-like MFS transporter
VGSAIGPVVGGVLLEQFAWGSVFLIALPVMALLLVLGPIVLPEYRDPDAGRLDLISAGLSLVAVLGVIFGLKQVAVGGIGPEAIVAAGVGLAAGVLFVRRQWRLTDPMIDLRLFRIPTFRVALSINFLTVFLSIGYFLFVAQYLQLVLGLSPLQAGFVSVPAAIGFTIGSNAAPRLLRYVRPARLMGGGLLLAAVGLALLTQIDRLDGLTVSVVASVIISLGLAPVFGLTTELVVGSAPPERAGAASGISETGAELGGALGISLLGSLGIAIYRTRVGEALPADLPSALSDAIRDTLGGALEVATTVGGAAGDVIIRAAQAAFVDGMVVVAAISTLLAIGVAVLAVTALRDVRPPGEEPATEEAATPDRSRPALHPASAQDA